MVDKKELEEAVDVIETSPAGTPYARHAKTIVCALRESQRLNYCYEIHDGDDWVFGADGFSSPAEAKKAGVDAGFEYVRVKSCPAALDAGAQEK